MFARWNLAYALQRQRNFNAAANEYRAAITHATNAKQRAMLHTFIGDVLRATAGENGNLDEAVQGYRNAIEIVYPDCYGWAHHNLGRIRQDQGKMNDAIAEFDKAATCEPDNPTFRDSLKQALQVQDAGALTMGHANR